MKQALPVGLTGSQLTAMSLTVSMKKEVCLQDIMEPGNFKVYKVEFRKQVQEKPQKRQTKARVLIEE